MDVAAECNSKRLRFIFDISAEFGQFQYKKENCTYKYA